ncbi:methyl-accepting chemotaxis protein [Ferrimonas balearica]|uniref:methyl-accepting chemotaxis protein n=1 Tax=Ferrimonas balearica TaxID=44012 RepID=UPI001C5935C2|nr:methyl-accepting chemotaxis protein [Ferrimonas balearica]MBW3165142.1 methyl-accepting chemotaxis protein [Ferrimonas balearica]
MRFSQWRFGQQIGSLSLVISMVVLAGLGTLTYQLSAQALRQTTMAGVESQLDAMAALVGIQYQSQRDLAEHNARLFADLFPGDFELTGKRVTVAGTNAPELRSGPRLINTTLAQVDRYAKITGGSATVFVRDGDDFLRIATSLRTETGNRATGTWLGTAHPGYQALINGQPYIGYATLFGREQITVYEPVIDANGAVIAVRFIGQDVTQASEQLASTLANIRLGQSGYFSLIDRRSGQFLYHPEMKDNADVAAQTDDQGTPRYQRALGGDHSRIERLIVNGEPWLQSSAEVAGPGWVLTAAAPEQELESALSNLRRFSVIASVVGCGLIGLLLTLMLARTLNRPLEALCQRIDAIGHGDLAQQLPEVPADSSNEVHRITASVATMAERLRQLLTAMNQSAQVLEQSASGLQTVAQQNGSSAAELMRQTDQIATAMEEMSCSVREVARHASGSAEHSQQVEHAAKDGDRQVDAVIGQMETLAQSLREGASSMDRVAEESQAIAKVVQVINEIAEQTNLLALNAAIEAARAGEQGRGFAVVADEVRSLAQRTQHSTKEIGDTIERLHQRTRDAVDQMAQNLSLSQQATGQSGEAGVALTQISRSVTQLAENATSIASAAEQQGVVADEIASNLGHITELARTSEQDAGQTVDAAHELSRLSESLRDHLGRFRL